MSEVLFRDEVFKIVGAAIEVHRELGMGFLEAVYQEALELELTRAEVPFESQAWLPVNYKGIKLNKGYCADIICYGAIVVELKALTQLGGVEEAQLHNYLRATGYRVGLLLNFGSSGRLEWKRWIV